MQASPLSSSPDTQRMLVSYPPNLESAAAALRLLFEEFHTEER